MPAELERAAGSDADVSGYRHSAIQGQCLSVPYKYPVIGGSTQ